MDKRFPTNGLITNANELWRHGGSVPNADLPFAMKHPLLLDWSHHLTLLHAHAWIQHNRVKETIAQSF